MKRPYCPLCCESLYNVEFTGSDYKTVLGYPCGHELPEETIEQILDFIDAKDIQVKKQYRQTYYWLYNAILPSAHPGPAAP